MVAQVWACTAPGPVEGDAEAIGCLLHQMMPGRVLLALSWIVEQEEVDGVLAIPSAMVKPIESPHALPLLPYEPSKR